MALTWIWAGFFIVGFVAALAQWIFLGDADVFHRIVDGTFTSARFAVMDIALPLAGVMTLWMGILAIGEKAGAIDAVARLIAPFFSRIFPGVPRDHPATGLMVMNYSANFLGLDNAATPIFRRCWSRSPGWASTAKAAANSSPVCASFAD